MAEPWSRNQGSAPKAREKEAPEAFAPCSGSWRGRCSVAPFILCPSIPRNRSGMPLRGCEFGVIPKFPIPRRSTGKGFPLIRERATALPMADKKAPTHIAYTLKRESRTLSRYIEIGAARIDKHGDIHNVYLDRLPVGGFTGQITLSPVNSKPPAPPEPQRPGEDEG